MELDVGVKISKTRDDITSVSEFRIAKDRTGPVFLSRETDTMFILTAHLTGYKRENIDIKINEDGTEISISGEKPVQERLMVGWRRLKKEVEIKGFKKIFKIPHGVILDRIKAKFNQEESMFKIAMPKLVKGISGVRIEKVKEGGGRGGLELEHSETEADHTSNSIEETSKEVSKESEIQKIEETRSVGEKMLGEATGETIQKENEESKIETEHKEGESVREKVINESIRDMKKSALGQNVVDHMTKKNGQTSQEVPKLSDIREWEEGTKGTAIDQNVVDYFPSNIDETNKEATSEKAEESERKLFEATEVTAKNKEPQIESVGKSKEQGREIGKGGIEAMKTSMEEYPQQVPEPPLEGNVGSKMEESEDVITAVIKRKSKEIECLEERVGGEESKKTDAKPNMVMKKNITKEETMQKGSEEPKIEHRHDDQQNVTAGNIVKGEIEALSGVTHDFLKQVEKIFPSLDGSKGFKVTKMEETEEVTEAMAEKKIKERECFMDKVKGDLESKSMHKEANEVIGKNTLKEAFQKEIEDSKIETNGNQQNPQENIVKGASKLLGTVIEKFAKQVEEAMTKMRKEIEGTLSKMKEEGSKKMHVEGNGDLEKDMVEDTIQKETREPRIGTKDSGQLSGQEKVDKRRFHVMATLRKMFPKAAAKILLDGSKGSMDTKGEETKEVKEESTKTESPVEKVRGEKIEKIYVKTDGDFREDVTRETTQKEMQDAKVETKDRDQQCVQEDISKESSEARGAATEEFSKQASESSLVEESEGSKVTNLDETKKVNEEFRKSGETEDLANDESTMEEETLQKAPETKHPTRSEKRTPEREVSQRSLKRERAGISKTAKDKKAEVKEISETMQENPDNERLRESAKATLEIGELKVTVAGAAAEEFEDVKPNNETGKSQREDLSASNMEVQSKVLHESQKPSMQQKILERMRVQHELGIQSKATKKEFRKVEPKGDSNKERIKELTSPFSEKLREEPYELTMPTMKQDTSKAEILEQLHKGKELIHSLQGTMAEKVDEPSKLLTPPSTKQFEVKGNGKTEEYCEDRFQESQEPEKQESEMKEDQNVEQTETSKPEFPADQQFIKDDQPVIGEEESHGRHEIEEETAKEQGDEASKDKLQESVVQKDLKSEASGEKKDDENCSKKLRAPLVVAGSAFLISLVVLFIRHKRAGKSSNMQFVLKRP